MRPRRASGAVAPSTRPSGVNIETVAIATLTPDPRNARDHTTGVPELAESLSEFGQRKNLVVWHDVVISGNGLMLAAQSLGWTHMEIDPRYVDVIIARWEKFTGKKAKLLPKSRKSATSRARAT